MYLLLIDPNFISSADLKELIAEAPAGTDILNSFSADTLLKVADSVDPDIVIIDFAMVDDDAKALFSKVRSISKRSRIIALIEENDYERLNEAIESGGIDDYMLKPINKADFIARVNIAATKLYASIEQIEEATLVEDTEDLPLDDLDYLEDTYTPLEETDLDLSESDFSAFELPRDGDENPALFEEENNIDGSKAVVFDLTEKITSGDDVEPEDKMEDEADLESTLSDETEESALEVTEFSVGDRLEKGYDEKEEDNEILFGGGKELPDEDEDLFDLSGFDDNNEDGLGLPSSSLDAAGEKEKDIFDFEFPEDESTEETEIDSDESENEEDFGLTTPEPGQPVETAAATSDAREEKEELEETNGEDENSSSSFSARTTSGISYTPLVKSGFDDLFDKLEVDGQMENESEQDLEFIEPHEPGQVESVSETEEFFEEVTIPEEDVPESKQEITPAAESMNNGIMWEESPDDSIVGEPLTEEEEEFFSSMMLDAEKLAEPDEKERLSPENATGRDYFDDLFENVSPDDEVSADGDGESKLEDIFADEPSITEDPVKDDRQSPFPGESADDFLYGQESSAEESGPEELLELSSAGAVSENLLPDEGDKDLEALLEEFSFDENEKQQDENIDKPQKKKNKLNLPSIFGIAGNVFFAMLLLFMAVLSFFLIQSRISGGVPKVAGYQVFIVLSGSMSPEFDTGSIAFVKETPPEELVVGDIITFNSQNGSDSLTTHRVVEVIRDGELQFVTRGDANNINDPYPVPAENVVGRVTGSVPRVGYVLDFVQTRQGLILLIFVPGILIILFELGKILKYLQQNQGTKDKKPEDQENTTPANHQI